MATETRAFDVVSAELTDAINDFTREHDAFVAKGVKAAAAKARKASLKIQSLLKEYRAASVEATR